MTERFLIRAAQSLPGGPHLSTDRRRRQPKIAGVPVVPANGEGPTQAHFEKLKPTVYLCVEGAAERGLSFDQIAIRRMGEEVPPAAT